MIFDRDTFDEQDPLETDLVSAHTFIGTATDLAALTTLGPTNHAKILSGLLYSILTCPPNDMVQYYLILGKLLI